MWRRFSKGERRKILETWIEENEKKEQVELAVEIGFIHERGFCEIQRQNSSLYRSTRFCYFFLKRHHFQLPNNFFLPTESKAPRCCQLPASHCQFSSWLNDGGTNCFNVEEFKRLIMTPWKIQGPNIQYWPLNLGTKNIFSLFSTITCL